jgi:membrane protease subunit HflC
MRILSFLAAIVLAIVLLFPVFTFTVKESQHALVFRLGEIVGSDYKPGLHFIVPVLYNVRLFDKRLLSSESRSERFLTKEGKNMIVDYYVQWRIKDVNAYYRSVGSGIGIAGETRAINRLSQITRDALQVLFSNLSMKEAITGSRSLILPSAINTPTRDIVLEEVVNLLNEDEKTAPKSGEARVFSVLQLVQNSVNEKAASLGVEIKDVRIKRIDLPAEVSSSVFRRMEKERATVAQQFRAEGDEEGKKIRAIADRQRTEFLSQAIKRSEEIRGEADAISAKVYADAYGQDPEFYRFYQSLTAYARVFSNGQQTLVLTPNSEFFSYFKGPNTVPGVVVDEAAFSSKLLPLLPADSSSLPATP